jgi:hypothetical protein
MATMARTQTKKKWPYLGERFSKERIITEDGIQDTHMPNTLLAKTGYPIWYIAPGRPSRRATVEEIKLAWSQISIHAHVNGIYHELHTIMHAIKACHQLSPTDIRLAPFDHWLALKAFYEAQVSIQYKTA